MSNPIVAALVPPFEMELNLTSQFSDEDVAASLLEPPLTNTPQFQVDKISFQDTESPSTQLSSEFTKPSTESPSDGLQIDIALKSPAAINEKNKIPTKAEQILADIKTSVAIPLSTGSKIESRALTLSDASEPSSTKDLFWLKDVTSKLTDSNSIKSYRKDC
jgi:hypothetical protein